MSTDLATAPAGVAHDDDHAHPTDRLFVRTAIILALITAAEVIWSYLPWPEEGRGWYLLEVGGLLVMMSWKFVMVAATFMHLKFDKKLLTYIFYGGLLLAVGVYVAALATFAFFTTGEPPMAP
jgi:cytochrome c oxidase subunit 4